MNDWCQNEGIQVSMDRDILRLSILALGLGEWMSACNMMCRHLAHYADQKAVKYEFSNCLTNKGNRVEAEIWICGRDGEKIIVNGQRGSHVMDNANHLTVQF